jgi:hypothetical protein
VATEQSWHQYVRAPSSEVVQPEAILRTHGSVSNADALISKNGFATLKRPSSEDPVPSITLDFGQNVVGFVRVHFEGASNNSPGVRLTFSETKEYLTNISDFTRSDNGDTITPGTDQFAVPSHPTIWTDKHGCLYNGTQVCADGLHGFRYMRIALDALKSDAPYTEPNGTVRISAVDLKWFAFLGTPETYTGWFECSDKTLTQYWFDAGYTNEMCTAKFTPNTTDPRDANSPGLDGKLVLQDGAKRDRDPYVGDIAVSGRTAYLTHAQTSQAAKNVLEDLANHQRKDGWIPPASISNYTLPLFDYPLWWVVSSWEYVLYSGDTDYAQQYWPNLVKVLDDFYPSVTNTSSGLLSKGLGVTEGYGDYAFLPRTGQVTYYNTLYVYGLQNAAAWAEYMQNKAAAKRWTARGSSFSKAINTHLWDAGVGAYLDSTNLTTSFNQTRHAQDGNGLAVLTGVAPPSRAKSALNYLSTHTRQQYGNAFYDGELPNVDNATQRVYAFISFFELQGRLLTDGLADSAIEEINRLYGWMATHDPTITDWEGIGPGGSPYEQGYTSMAHGWSTGIVSLLSNYVLGVMPTGPGFATWNLKPVPAGLKWASGTVSTPHGDIVVNWSVKASGFTMSFNVPKGTTAQVSVPAAGGQKLKLDGKAMHTTPHDGYMVLDTVEPGKHEIDVQ